MAFDSRWMFDVANRLLLSEATCKWSIVHPHTDGEAAKVKHVFFGVEVQMLPVQISTAPSALAQTSRVCQLS